MGNPLGGVTLEEIKASSANLPLPENAGAAADTRFVLKISALVTTRIGQGESGGFTVFLQSDALKSDAEGCSSAFYPLLASGNDPISPRIWLSNAGLGGAYALDVDCVDQTRIFEEIQEAGFGHLPAVVIDWRGAVPVGRHFISGVDDLDYVQEIELAYTEITKENLEDCLNNFHRTSLQTPQRVREGHAEAIWANATKGWPAHRPEERIQGKLIQHLRARYTKHVVRAEPKNDDGITDLVIFAHTFNVANKKIVVKEWVLELKALTDHTSTGNSVSRSVVQDALDKGLTQAIAYRDKEHAGRAALCCYDMRSKDEGSKTCFGKICVEAERNNVVLWRWYIFRSSERSRVADRVERQSSRLAER